mmetsp:Transcript_19087/g.36185  ORF Transcript_19087/g.36185 Transcript_19087/m.36185 type:complete len:235 (+) Transcript_19087:58-762(+)
MQKKKICTMTNQSISKAVHLLGHAKISLLLHVLQRGVLILFSNKFHFLSVILFLSSALFSIFGTRDILDSELPGCDPSDVIFEAEHVLAHNYTCETHFSPVFSPRIANNPIRLATILIHPISGNGDNMIRLSRGTVIIQNTSLVIAEGIGVDGGGDGTAGVDLRLDLLRAGGVVVENVGETVSDGSVFRYSGIWEIVQLDAFAPIVAKCVASTASVDSRASGVHMWAESLLRLF